MKNRYTLPANIVAYLRNKTPHFGLGAFGETLFYTRYSRVKPDGRNEDWCDVIIRCVEGVFSIRKDWYYKNQIEWDEEYWNEYAFGFANAMYDMKFLPPGRGLWAMGTDFIFERGSMALNNCFSGSTKYVSDGEIKTLKETLGKTIQVITKEGPKTATVQSFGEQQLYKLFFRLPKKSNHTLVYEATRNHRWLLSNGEETTYIREKDKVIISPGNVKKHTDEYKDGFVHGMVFADGCNHYKDKYNLQLFGWKKNFSDQVKQSKLYSHETETFGYILQSQIDLKKLPKNCSLEYKQGFFDSWSLFDGHSNPKSETLDTISEEGAKWVIEHSGLLNYVVTGHSIDNSDTNFGKRTKPLNRISFVFEPIEMFLKTILPSKKEEVFCVVEPETHTFMLSGGLITGNCGFKVIGKNIGNDAHWCMDALMCGVGVGFKPERDDTLTTYQPKGTMRFIVPDTREGWCDSVKALIDCYLVQDCPKPEFDYSEVRPEGLPIKGFGGLSSGPEPLRVLHKQIEKFFVKYHSEEQYDSVLLKADIINAIGCCVVAGNVRRSAEIACGDIDDDVFLNLKDYDAYPYRAEFGWMSNNSAILSEKRHYSQLGKIAKRVIKNGEPGIINYRNMWKGRIGKKDEVQKDPALGYNPCGEISLCDAELCCLVETCPTRCVTVDGEFDEYGWYKALEYATFYASTVTLLPTHRQETNKITVRNRRIGVSIMDYANWVCDCEQNRVISFLREGYLVVRRYNKEFNSEAGIPESIRVTTVKPGGTVPKIVGVLSGMMHPNFHYMIRRVRMAANSPMVVLLKEAGIPWEVDAYSANTLCFEFPIYQGPAKPASKVSLWEQAFSLMTLQSEWSDNAVSNTLTFRPAWSTVEKLNENDSEGIKRASTKYGIDIETGLAQHGSGYEFGSYRVIESFGSILVQAFNPNHEEEDIEKVLSCIVPHIKSLSLLPHSDSGVYVQMPEEGITKEEYETRLAAIKPINWANISGVQSEPELYCTGPSCEIPIKAEEVPF